MGFDTGRFIEDRERADQGGIVVGEAIAVFGGLGFDAGEGRANFFGFDGADGMGIDEEEVVGFAVAGFEGDFADGDATGGVEVEGGAVLDKPPGSFEGGVDLEASDGFGGGHTG